MSKAGESADSPLDFLWGELNPINMGSDTLVTPDMIIDDKMAVHRQLMTDAARPNVISSDKTYKGVVAFAFFDHTGNWNNMARRVSGTKPPGRQAARVWIPELHACPNPLITTDPEIFTAIVRLLPKFVGDVLDPEEDDTQETYAPPGSIVEVGWEDNNFSYGVIKKVLVKNTDGNLSSILTGARELMESEVNIMARADAGEASAWNPSSIDCESPTPKRRNPVLQLTTEQVAAWKYIAPFLPEGAKLSSGTRGSDQQVNIIIRYAKREDLPGAEWLQPSDSAGVEEARQKLVTGQGASGKKYAISSVVRAPDAPSQGYSGHYGGLAIDISGGDAVFLRSVEAAVRKAEESIEGFSTTLILPEVPPRFSNMCIHVEVPKGLTFDAEKLKEGWQTATGCRTRDPNEEISDISSNYSWEFPGTGEPDSSVEGSSPENSDQLNLDVEVPNLGGPTQLY